MAENDIYASYSRLIPIKEGRRWCISLSFFFFSRKKKKKMKSSRYVHRENRGVPYVRRRRKIQQHKTYTVTEEELGRYLDSSQLFSFFFINYIKISCIYILSGHISAKGGMLLFCFVFLWASST